MATNHVTESRTRRFIGIGAFLLLSSFVMLGCGGSDLLVKGPYMRGVDLYDEGDSRGAIVEYQAALVDKPEDHRVHYNLALCFHDLFLQAQEAGNTEEAAKNYARAEESYRNSEALTDLKAKAQVARAKLLWDTNDQENQDAAIAMLQDVKGDDGTGEAMPIWTRGTMLSQKGKMGEARAAYDEALTVDEAYIPALTARAEMKLKAGELASARDDVTKGLKKKKHDVTLLALDARIAHQEAMASPSPEMWRECLTRWRLVEAISTTDWEALYGIAYCAEQLGETQLAVRYYWHCRDHASEYSLARRGEDPEAFKADVRQRLLKLYPQLSAGE